ncbi:MULTISPECIES: DUF2975 domain-containing protein [Dehalobacter]|jgi:hypothetical protein|uniref:DUF2975 domain-containing protein n=2 Tax=Dehalobacter restrictus TaxID=55583 RepID=A0A857DG75_9FIRM|nr:MULTISPECIES: DUF2975 domain-containing protein [Dehalobacter]AHF11212.1 hypothetical protein DEHRE_01635 [Dehalobacter restrictus DSM 9455]MCG1025503.1 DUF2975 domain-containing protein [Dehalobacter sp.]MDJ0306106.1 DUF2975 domain-containing protein [Dehalobacter sp.]OCZ51935.1 hypothetical protein A7D23_12250 [Dehalobacter sp. TeCB1]QGZ99501.1 DUF2975 domain-containing protein [Dehalobacter restrictus]
MRQDNIIYLKERTRTINNILSIIFIIGIILLFATLIVCFILFFTPEQGFTVEKGNLDWFIEYNLANGTTFGVYIPFSIIQSVAIERFNAKSAFLTYLVSSSILNIIILYGIKQVIDILNTILKSTTPFNTNNVIRLKKIVLSIIIYSVAADPIKNFLGCVFVTKIYYFDFSNIHISGILIAVLISIIADVFKYGILLQEKVDTTF